VRRSNTNTPKKEPIMGKILVHEFISLDGVFETPTWTFDYPIDPKMGEAIGGIMGSSAGLLLGRQTFEEFAPAWSARSAEVPGATFMNESPKYVVSATLQNPEWSNSTVLGAYDAETIRSLKNEVSGNLYVSGSGTLVRALIEDRLIDDLHLFVFPLVLGSGQRLFPDGGSAIKLALAAAESYDSGVAHLTYQLGD
jgi:dihydrofolate reductase